MQNMCRVLGGHKVQEPVVCGMKSIKQRDTIFTRVHVTQFVLQAHTVNIHSRVTHKHGFHHVKV